MAVQITDTEISNRATPLVDRPYHLGDVTGVKGWDCLSGLISFYGDALPTEFKGVTRENYAALWKKDEAKARGLLAEFLLSLGTEIDLLHSIRGDLVILCSAGDRDNGSLWAGIYLGCGNLWVCAGPKGGCRVLPLKAVLNWVDQEIVSIRRILK